MQHPRFSLMLFLTRNLLERTLFVYPTRNLYATWNTSRSICISFSRIHGRYTIHKYCRQNFQLLVHWHIDTYNSGAYLGPCQTSVVEVFVKIVDSTAWKVSKYGVLLRKIRTRKNFIFRHFSRSDRFYLLAIYSKYFIIDVW